MNHFFHAVFLCLSRQFCENENIHTRKKKNCFRSLTNDACVYIQWHQDLNLASMQYKCIYLNIEKEGTKYRTIDEQINDV